MKICLNMIVKNESHIICRALKSVRNLIDYYVICDTGSDDNTCGLVQDFFNDYDISGQIFHTTFKNFEINRNEALHYAKQYSSSEFILLMDADMVLQYNLPVSSILNVLQSHDIFHLYQGSDDCLYKNIRIVRSNLSMEYKGVTHEYLDYVGEPKVYTFDAEDFRILDIGDGGCKQDKFERDIRLLSDGLRREPKNVRYMFYLANSYRDYGDISNAIIMYQTRGVSGGWVEEVWYSYYQIGKCYMELKDPEKAIGYWLTAFQVFKERIENLYQIVRYYRECGEHELAYHFYFVCKEHLANITLSSDHLFFEKDVYDYKLDYEYTVIAYYLKKDRFSVIEKIHLLLSKDISDTYLNSIWNNFKFYKTRLENLGLSYELFSKQECNDGFYPSSPSFIFIGENKLLINVRCVNYAICEDGSYVYDGAITTENIMFDYDLNTHQKMNIRTLEYNRDKDNHVYRGIEDIRLFHDGERVIYTGTRGYSYSHIGMETGELVNLKYLQGKPFLKELDSGSPSCEKNWVCFQKNKELFYIYSWNPLVIGKKEMENMDLVFRPIYTQEMKPIFKEIRGSTNGIWYNGELWFVCHRVSYESKRHYYHIIVCMDENFRIIRTSRFFTFEGQAIEYCLGFQYHSNNLHFGYSVNDGSSKMMVVPIEEMYDMML